ncbi:heterokaryon incompatibility protein-domain-containing protein [Hypoxylon sp. FL1857]|nr:heterokaryon incompatibility protein-domain-containing protein [Hypoxylon sp. FL1857]
MVPQGIRPVTIPGVDSIEGVDLGSLRRIWSEPSCPFCDLVRYTFEAYYGKSSIEVAVSIDASGALMNWTPLNEIHNDLERSAHDIPYYVELSVSGISNDQYTALHAERLAQTYGSKFMFNPCMIALQDGDGMEPGQPIIHFGKTVEPDRIDWPMIKGWLDSCSSKHFCDGLADLNHNPLKQNNQLQLRVIDVSKACVVTLPCEKPYIALSYVWGKDQALKLTSHNQVSLHKEGCFNRIQDDAENIQVNVERMSQIYSDAHLTIVAAAGTNADYGLLGVSPKRPRSIRQKRVTIQGLTIANRLGSHITSSYWNKRGWTYQERILSLKLLTFTLSYVIYYCDEGCDQDEQFHMSHDGAQYTPFDMTSKLDFAINSIFEVYAFAVTEYTKRSITNPMDKVKAFRGLLDVLEEPFKCPFFFGLPVSMFDIGLLWIPLGRCRRGNKGFPSWSWAGWNGATAYDYIQGDTLTNICQRTVSQCSIVVKETDIHLCHTSTPGTDNAILMKDQSKWTRHLDDETSEIYYRDTERETRLYRYPRPLSAVGQKVNYLLSKEPSPILDIQGRVAKFRLTGQHSNVRIIDSPSCLEGQHNRCDLAILDREDRAVGRVRVDPYDLSRLYNREHKFLALSRTTVHFGPDDIS